MLRFPGSILVLSAVVLVACGGGGSSPRGSNHLWVADKGANAIYGFSFDQLAATGAPSPAIGIGTGAGSQTYGLAMGPGGELWVALPSSNVVARFTASQLTASGSPTPATTVAANFPDGVIFDGSGNLWVSRATGRQALRFARSDVSGSGALTPTPSLTLNLGTSGLAFELLKDGAGHLWFVDKGDDASIAPTYMRAPDSVLTATGTTTLTADVSITSSGQLWTQGVAFDGDGALWATILTASPPPRLVRYGASQLTSSGSVTPQAQITVTGATSLGRLAFDASGNLWIADFNGRVLLRLPRSQLVGSGSFTIVPDVVVTTPSAAVPGLTGIAFDPTPDGLPIEY